MIYSASLGAYSKKAFGRQVHQTQVKHIIENLSKNPEESKMDVVLLGPKDLSGIAGRNLSKGLEEKHDEIIVIYLYIKEKDKDKGTGELHRVQVDKYQPDSIKKVVQEVIDLSLLSLEEKEVQSRDEIEGVLVRETIEKSEEPIVEEVEQEPVLEINEEPESEDVEEVIEEVEEQQEREPEVINEESNQLESEEQIHFLLGERETMRSKMGELNVSAEEPQELDKTMEMVHHLINLDDKIIQYQHQHIEALEAGVEEPVAQMRNNLEEGIQVFVGPDDVGRTATALIWSGVLSRRKNTLVLDFTRNSKYGDYGIQPVTLDDFLGDKFYRYFNYVRIDKTQDFDLNEVSDKLKNALNYYPHITIILDADQIVLRDFFGNRADRMYYITNCTPRSISQIKECVSTDQITVGHKKVVLIDPPIDPNALLKEIEVYNLHSRITIPHCSKIKAYSLTGVQPYADMEVVELFESAFKQEVEL